MMFLFWKSSLLNSKRNGDFKMDGGGAKVQQPNAADMLCIEFISTHAVVAPDLVVRFASSSGQHHQSIIGAVLSHRPLIIKIIYLTCSLRIYFGAKVSFAAQHARKENEKRFSSQLQAPEVWGRKFSASSSDEGNLGGNLFAAGAVVNVALPAPPSAPPPPPPRLPLQPRQIAAPLP